MDLAQAIRAEMERRGLNQLQAAEEIGVGQSVLSRWTGTNPPRPSPENCARLARFVRMSAADVQQLAGYPVSDEEPGTESDPEWEMVQRELKEIYDSLARSKWRDLTTGVRVVASLSEPSPKDSAGGTPTRSTASITLSEPRPDDGPKAVNFPRAKVKENTRELALV